MPLDEHVKAFRTEMQARAERFDKQRIWLRLHVLPQGATAFRYAIETGPATNSDSYICASGFGFATFEEAKAKGVEALRACERSVELEREGYLKFGRK